ncbi:MAG: hypothetical protein ACRCTP_00085 [Aeromonas popoffii]|uniref:hypothetical protein n=1 Tax=Aeromonas popoffii TaxID=70856 RepID=UPI003F40816A
MKRVIKSIPLDLIKLDQDNVRFGGDVAQSQREAIELIMADPDDGKKLLRLANHIAENGLDPTELQLVTPDGDSNYVVLEGNRRLTALKLLQKPDLCPDEKLLKGFIEAQKKLNGGIPAEIEFSVVPSRSAGDIWIELKHTGENAGVGRVNWSGDIRDERRARQTGIESIGRQVRNLIKDNSRLFSPHTVKDVFSIPVTTLTRLFSSKPAQDAFGYKIEDKEIVLLYPLLSVVPSIEFAINLFCNEGYNVNDIRNDADRKRFVQHIPPELNPSKINKPNNSTTTMGGNYTGEPVVGEPEGNGKPIPTDIDGNIDGVTQGEPVTSGTKGIKAKPSSRARKYLIPWSLNIKNNRINEIYRELRTKLEVDKVVNAVAITFRVFIEVSCDEVVKRESSSGLTVNRHDNGKPLNDNDKLSIKVASVVKHLENQGKINVEQARAIAKRATAKETIGSVDHFNQFVHGTASAPISSEIKDIADEYRPMLEAIWS